MKNYVIMAILLIMVMIFTGCGEIPSNSLPKITEQPQATKEVIVIQQTEEPIKEVVIT